MPSDNWLTGISADWSDGADWSNGAPPSASVSAVINAPGSYVVTLFGTGTASALTIDAASALFYDAGALSIGGSLVLQAGTLALATGAIDGGTLALAGGVLQSTGGTLNDVAVQGVLSLGAAESSLVIENGLSVTGTSGSGAGSIALTGAYAALDFVGSQALNNAVVSLGAAGSLPGQTGPATLGVLHAGGATQGATLTLGSALWVRDAGGQGALTVGSGGLGQGPSLPDALVNKGSITVSGTGAVLTISGSGTFDNQGILGVSGGATLSLATAGVQNTGSIVVGGGTLALGGSFQAGLLAGLGAITVTGGTVEIAGTATNTGGTLSLGAGTAITGSLGALPLAGTLLGGTVLDSGGGLSFVPGTGVLDGVSYVGSLNLSAAGAGVILTDGSEIAGAITDTGAGAALLLRGMETLDNATIALGSTGVAAAIGTSDAFLSSIATTATLGPHLLVRQTGTDALLGANGWSEVPGLGPADTLVNQGTITAALAGGQFGISGVGSFINQGAIAVSNGDTLSVSVDDFGNPGTLTAGPGGMLEIGQNAGFFGAAPIWSNAGRIVLDGGTITLGGSLTTAQLGTITETAGAGGVIVLNGALNNAGSTLSLGTGQAPGFSLPALALSGSIAGGSIADPGGILAVGSAGGALLDGVAYQGTLALTQAGAFLRVHDGLAVSGAIEVLGAGAVLDCLGSQTIGNTTILLGAAAAAASIDIAHDSGISGGSTLTLGAGTSITQAGALAQIGQAGGLAGDSIVSLGTITAATAGGTLTLGGPGIVNAGRIAVSNGDTLAIAAVRFSNTGSITITNAELSLSGALTLAGLGAVTLSNASMAVSGTLGLGGGTLSIGTGSAIGRLVLTGMLAGGTVVDAGFGLASSGTATLEDVTYAGLLDLSRPFATLTIAGGIGLTGGLGSGTGSILLTGAQARLIAGSSETIDNAQISLGSVAQLYQGQHLAAPELAAAAGVQLTLGAGTSLTLAGTAGTLGDAGLGQWTDSIVNAGRISAATAGGALTLGSSFFTNSGTIGASGGGIVTIDDVGFTNTGLLSVGALSAVQVGLYDFYAAPDPGSSVLTNAGTIAMLGGILQEITANGLFPGVPLANLPGASIRGSGMVFAPIGNAGTIEANGGALVLKSAVTGAGTLLIDPGGTLELAAGAAATQIAKFAGPGGTLRLDQPASFAGTLSQFGTGDTIDLPGIILTGVGLSSGTLVASTATTNDRLPSRMPLAGALSSGRDAHGGATITITPQTVGKGSMPAVLPVTQTSMLFWASPAGDVFRGPTADVNGAHISNWSAADSIDLIDMNAGAAVLSLSQAPGLATIRIGDGTHTASIGIAGTYSATSFHLAPDGSGGTLLTYTRG